MVKPRACLPRGPARKRPKVVKLPKPVVDSQMTDTLIFLLEHARAGRIHAFSVCLIGEREDGTEFSIESAGADGDDRMELQLLGVMRGAEEGLMLRRRERKDG